MDPERLREILERVRDGALDPEDALGALKHLPFENLGFARVDHHRQLRQGWPEAIFCEGKRPGEVAAIARAIVDAGSNLLATRLSPEAFAVLEKEIPGVRYNPRGRTAVLVRKEPERGAPVPVLTAGTSDIPVAEEAAETLLLLGHEPERVYDVGVAGVHRLYGEEERIRSAPVLIVVAGMEGALLSVVAGLTGSAVIGVPTSVGYGTALRGFTPLFSMLNSCASGAVVVNIDNGFGAASAAHRILRSSRERP
ncbi:MAG: nickel pincer cofactor biosynthesis protein LarB [Candidatus Eisenbacteria bacterium]|nr:nickel pincer cofactor biosynthesis protein LarB [Candidatus Eisenbacteria bacterium]